jgi:hypothetical protein
VARDNSPIAVTEQFLAKYAADCGYTAGGVGMQSDFPVLRRRLIALIAAERGRCARVAKAYCPCHGPEVARDILALNKPPRRGRKEK